MGRATSLYRKVHGRLYRSERFRRLRLAERYITLCLLTTDQTNSAGLYYLSVVKEAEGIMPVQQFRNGIATVCKTFGWKYDAAASVVYFPSWFKYNPPMNPNQIQGVFAQLLDLPQTPLLQEFIANQEHLSEAAKQWFVQLLPNRLQTVSQRYVNTDTDTDTDTDTKEYVNTHTENAASPLVGLQPTLPGDDSPVPSMATQPAPSGSSPTKRPKPPSGAKIAPADSKGPSLPKCPYGLIVACWNKERDRRKVLGAQLSDRRAAKLRARWRSDEFRKHWRESIETIQKVAFYCGDNDQGWVIDFDYWSRNDDTWRKAWDQNRDKRERPTTVQHGQSAGHVPADPAKYADG